MALTNITCQNCGNPIPSSDEFCGKCGIKKTNVEPKKLSETEIPYLIEKKSDKDYESSGWWTLLPIFFGVIGGITAFIVLRKEDYWSAKFHLGLGIGVTFIAFCLYFFLFANMLSSIGYE